MTDRASALRAAILAALPVDPDDDTVTLKWADAEQLTDDILAAIAPVLDEGVTVEWAYRYPNGHIAWLIPELTTEELVRSAAAEHPELLTVVRRRVSGWEEA